MLLKNTINISTTLLLLLMSASLFAQDLWQPIESSRIPNPGERYIIPSDFKTYALDELRVEQILKEAPEEDGTIETYRSSSFLLPMPDGTMRRYGIVNSPVMAPDLAKKYPEIQTYSGYDLDNPANTVRFDLTPHGFHAMAFTQEFGTVYIDPYSFQKKGYYMVYRKMDFQPIAGKEFVCGVAGKAVDTGKFKPQRRMGTAYGDCTKRTYRFAVGATGEYTTFHGGTVALALAAQVTTMNRVNGIYMREMAIFMEIVANNDVLIFTNAATDPYSNNSAGALINEIQTECDNEIGAANYDIGHVFSTGGGGLAGLGVICLGGQKARGVTGTATPVNDPFDIDYVAHEIGHQFGCNHTFNNSCDGNINPGTAMEPGSGSTIMAYAGICAPNVQNNSDDHFHAISLEEMSNTILSTSCAVTSTIANTTPTINSVTTSYTIPGGTPFMLTTDAIDGEGHVMTYCWEQMDNQSSTQAPIPSSTGGPNFRSNSPVLSPTRYFPNLADLAAGISPTWEVLAEVNRTYNFRVSVRDNFIDGGCTTFENATISVIGDTGLFLVTDPTATGIVWPTGGTETVTWDVAGTTDAPFNCTNVDILLSTDGGLTYPTTLASGVTNSGSFNVTVPNTPSTTCRVMVVCSDNVFFNISNEDFEIQISGPDFSVTTAQNAITVCSPDDAIYTIDVTAFNGFADDITLSATGVPAGATASFSANPITGGTGASDLTITSAGVTPGTYTITVEGTNGTDTRMVDIDLTVEAGSPGDMTLLDPADGSIDVNTGLTLSWSPATNAASYDIEVATDPAFTNIVDSASSISGTSYTISGLSISTTYYWRVVASNACGVSNLSDVWSFTTIDIVACSDFTSGPYVDFNPVPSACFNNCTPVSQAFEVWQNESYSLFNLAGGEEYTFEFCNGYDPATWEALITIAEFDALTETVVTGSEFGSALGCSLTFTVPATGDYVIIISDPTNCGGPTLEVDNGVPTLTCTGLAACCGATFTDAGGVDADYLDDLSYVSTICPDGPNQIIEVNFSEFSVEENAPNDCYDFLTIYDGDNTSAPQIGGEYCDVSGSPGIVTATGATGCLTFEFFSDGSVGQAGWVASVTCISDCPVDLTLTAGQTTGSILIEASNNITSSELISGNAQVDYSAGTDIDLEFPFEVTLGAELHAYILGCASSN